MPVVARGDGFAVGVAVMLGGGDVGPEETVKAPVIAGDADAWPEEREGVDVATVELALLASAASGGQDKPDEKLDAIALKEIAPGRPRPIAARGQSGDAGPWQGDARVQSVSGPADDGEATPRLTEGAAKQNAANTAQQALPVSGKAGETAPTGPVGAADVTAAPAGSRESVRIAAVREVAVPQLRSDSGEVRRVVVRLEPQHFGKVAVVMMRRGEEFSMRVMPEQAAAADMLKNDTGVLARLLRAAGVSGETVTVQIVVPERAMEAAPALSQGQTSQQHEAGHPQGGFGDLAAGRERRAAGEGFDGAGEREQQGEESASGDDDGKEVGRRRADGAVYL